MRFLNKVCNLSCNMNLKIFSGVLVNSTYVCMVHVPHGETILLCIHIQIVVRTYVQSVVDPCSRLVTAWHYHWPNTFTVVEIRGCSYRISLTSLLHCISLPATLMLSWIYSGVLQIKVVFVCSVCLSVCVCVFVSEKLYVHYSSLPLSGS